MPQSINSTEYRDFYNSYPPQWASQPCRGPGLYGQGSIALQQAVRSSTKVNRAAQLIHFGSKPIFTNEVPEFASVKFKGHELAEASQEALKQDGPGHTDRKAKLKKASKAMKPPSSPVATGKKRKSSSTQALAGSGAKNVPSGANLTQVSRQTLFGSEPGFTSKVPEITSMKHKGSVLAKVSREALEPDGTVHTGRKAIASKAVSLSSSPVSTGKKGKSLGTQASPGSGAKKAKK